MIKIKRTTSDNPDFQRLVDLLDAELAIRDGEEHAFYDQFNSIESINHVVLYYDGARPVSCGAIKDFGDNSVEVKRMYTLEKYRGIGLATAVLKELENWARELNAEKCVLETGVKQPEAIRLYQKNGYSQIANYGQYENVAASVCFAKDLS